MAQQIFKYALAAVTIFAGLQSSSIYAQSSSPAGGVNLCQGVKDYIFLTDITNCSNYYICVNEQPILQTCGANMYFHEPSQACNYNKATCLTCDPAKLSVHPLVKTCNKYVMCYAGQPILRQCCDDLQVDANGICNLPTKVDCVANQCNIQNDAGNIVYIPSQADCSSYYICMSGTPVKQTCANNLLFNPACNCCDLASRVTCSIKTPKSSLRSSTTKHTEPKMVDIGCPATGSYFYPHPNPNQYYMCVNGLGAVLTCAEGLFYDSKMQECRQLKNILLNSSK